MKHFSLVTGGAGFIGSHIVEALVRRGDQVRVLDNLATGRLANLAPWSGQIEFLEGSLLDARIVQRAVRGVDVVFHEAALPSVFRSVEAPLATHEACVTGTLVLLDQARQAGVRRLVYAASSSAYGNLPFVSKRESDLPGPLSPYAAAKLAAEYYCQCFHATYGLETVGLRYFNVFGPRQDPHSPYSAVIPLFISKILRGEKPLIYGDGTQTRDFTYVENVVQANLLAAKAPEAAGLVLNIANGGSTSLLELLATINRFLGANIEPQFGPARTGDVRASLADLSLARRVLNYEPLVSLEEGLRRTIEYYQGVGTPA